MSAEELRSQGRKGICNIYLSPHPFRAYICAFRNENMKFGMFSYFFSYEFEPSLSGENGMSEILPGGTGS